MFTLRRRPIVVLKWFSRIFFQLLDIASMWVCQQARCACAVLSIELVAPAYCIGG
jgi:hypothetical protein